MEVCPQDKRVSLEIRFDDDGKVSLARCCFLYAFSHLTLEEYGKIEDIIDYAENSKINYAKSSNICVAKCYLEKRIKQVDVGISHACNMHCMNCFFKEHKDTPEMKKAYFDTLYKIKGHQLDTIMMNNGGEVFVYYDEITKYLKSLTPNDTRQVTFVTNLVLLNEERFKELKQISEDTGVTYFFLPSIDGIKKESYEAIRLGGKFEKITENLHLLADVFGPQQAVILYTIKKPNIDETEEVEKYFMDTFGIRCSISFDVYDKECEEKYNSIFRKDYKKEEKEVSKKEDDGFVFLQKQQQTERLPFSIVTDTNPDESFVKSHPNNLIFVLTSWPSKKLKKYQNVILIKTSKKDFYQTLSSKVYTKYFMYCHDLSSIIEGNNKILTYFLGHSNKNVLKVENCINQNSIMSIANSTTLTSCGLIIKTDFFRKNFFKFEYSKNIALDFVKNLQLFLKQNDGISIPENILSLNDKKLYKDFFKWNFVQI